MSDTKTKLQAVKSAISGLPRYYYKFERAVISAFDRFLAKHIKTICTIAMYIYIVFVAVYGIAMILTRTNVLEFPPLIFKIEFWRYYKVIMDSAMVNLVVVIGIKKYYDIHKKTDEE